MESPTAEVIVVGGGPAGLTAAIALAWSGIETVLVAGRAREGDHRTTALLAGSVKALATLGGWERCHDLAAPLRVMRIINDTKPLLLASEVPSGANEIGLA